MSRHLTDAEFVTALDDLIIADILSMTGEELRAEIIAEGGDPDAMVRAAGATLVRAIRECEAARTGEKAPAGKLPAVASFW